MRRTLLTLLICILAAGASPGKTPRLSRRGHRASKAGASTVPLDPPTVNDPNLIETVGPRAKGGAVLRAQVLLARAHFSCGEIDARYGSNLGKAIQAFEKSRGLPATGVVDAATWQALDVDTAPVVVRAMIAPGDVAGPFAPIPDDTAEKSKLPALGYTCLLEALAEKYHASPELLASLNPGAVLDKAGATIQVPNVAGSPPGKAARVVVSKSQRSIEALDADGRVLAWYPATIGSVHDPLPVGQWKILGVSRNPDFHYNPDLFWDAKSTDTKARLAPGPNNPVGVAWIELSKAHYGIHGTPEPSTVGKTQSHGCIRLTNWDVWELAQMVSPGTPAVLEN